MHFVEFDYYDFDDEPFEIYACLVVGNHTSFFVRFKRAMKYLFTGAEQVVGDVVLSKSKAHEIAEFLTACAMAPLFKEAFNRISQGRKA